MGRSRKQKPRPRPERSRSPGPPEATSASAASAARGPAPPWWTLPAVLLVVLLAYQPAWHGGLLWDDDRHLTATELQSTAGLVRIWTDLGATQQYYPVVHTVFWLQHRFWGDDTLGYHLVTIALHGLSAFLLATLLSRLRVPGARLAALLFALHPLHVESVAWISELKNTLSGSCYLLAALAYLEFDRTRSWRPYATSALMFLLALGSKTVTATLPAALLVVFWWQRGRPDHRRDVLPLIPFMAAGVTAGLFTAWVEHAYIGARGMAFDLTWMERGLVAGRALWFYLAKLVWPFGLAFTYPRWDVDQSVWWQYLYPLGVLVVVGASWRLRHQTRTPLAVVLLFAGTLLPALGFVDVYPFRFSYVADHFAYLASIPVLAAAAAVAGTLGWRLGGLKPAPPAGLVQGRPGAGGLKSAHPAGRSQGSSGIGSRYAPPRSPWVASGLVLAVALLLGYRTWSESHNYASAEILYRETIRRNPGAWIAHNNLASLMLDDRPSEAAVHLEEALRLEPGLAEAHNNRGILWHREGRIADALGEYERAASLEPGLARAHNNRCLALTQLGRPAEGLGACEAALAIDPDYPEALYHSGAALQMLGRDAEATARFERAVTLDPSYAEVHYQLGLASQRAGRLDEAVTYFRTAASLRPRFAEAHNDLGLMLARIGRPDEAVAAFSRALEARPGFADAAFNLANTLLGLGRPAEAVRHFQTALAARPDDGAAHNNLGVALLETGRPQEAVPHFREALRLSPDLSQARENLARALAGGGG